LLGVSAPRPRRPSSIATRIVKVGRDHSDRALWYSRNGDVPECGWQALDEVDREPVVRPPRGKQGRS